MTPKLFFSSGAYVEPSLEARLDQCEREGLGGFEFSSGLAYTPGLVEQVRAPRRRNLDFLIHNYSPPPAEPFVLNLASSEENIAGPSLALCRLAIQLTAELQA